MSDSQQKPKLLSRLSDSQVGVVFIAIAVLMLCYVSYQIATGQVLTKTGVTTLGIGWPFLAIEVVAAVVGIVRGINWLVP